MRRRACAARACFPRRPIYELFPHLWRAAASQAELSVRASVDAGDRTDPASPVALSVVLDEPTEGLAAGDRPSYRRSTIHPAEEEGSLSRSSRISVRATSRIATTD